MTWKVNGIQYDGKILGPPNLINDEASVTIIFAGDAKEASETAERVLAFLNGPSLAEAARELRQAVIKALDDLRAAPELNPRNFDEDDAMRLNDVVCQVFCDLESAILGKDDL